MKQTIKSTISIVLSLLFLLSLVACNTVDKSGSWEDAIHLSNKTFGDGAKTVQVEVKADDQSLTFTIKTDKAFLGEALAEHDLIVSKDGPYARYVTTVNGIFASDDDHTYWALYKNGEYSLTGVDTTPIADGEHYELVKEKY